MRLKIIIIIDMNVENTPQSQQSKEVCHGRNVKRLREILGIKQDTLADALGLSQQTVSRLESQEEIDDDTLRKIAKALNIPMDTIKNFNDDAVVNIISNTFNEQSVAYQYNFNPIDKIIALYDEKIALYERLLKTEQNKSDLFEKLLKER